MLSRFARFPRLVALLTFGIVSLIPSTDAGLGIGSFCDGRGHQAATEIFVGIIYGCERLASTDEGSGFLQWTRIDLTAPGIELFRHAPGC